MRRLVATTLALAAGAALLWSLQCAGGRFVTSTGRVVAVADSVFTSGDFLHAKQHYMKIIASYPNSDWAEEAQYKLAYLCVYYSNPYADWETALREFTKYQAQYPNGRWINEANSWLSALHSIQSYNDGYKSRSSETEKLLTKHTFEVRKAIGLGDSLLHCEQLRDSLAREIGRLNTSIRELEDFIVRLR